MDQTTPKCPKCEAETKEVVPGINRCPKCGTDCDDAGHERCNCGAGHENFSYWVRR